MNFSANCPSCGGALDIPEQAVRAKCPFCGSTFELDLSSASPQFRKSAPGDVFVPNDADILTPPPADPPAVESYSPPPADIFSPGPEQTFDLPFIAQTARRLVSPRLWFGLAAAIFSIFCVSCLCLLGIVRLLFGNG